MPWRRRRRRPCAAVRLCARGCGSGQSGPGPLDHCVAFQLGEGDHDGEHRLAHRASEPDPARRQVVDDGENVLGVAPEAVELPDSEHVTYARVVQAPTPFPPQ